MELPAEVLAIIREYAKPVFPYYREYKQALERYYLDEWTTLRKKLNDDILVLLLAHQKASEDWHQAMKEQMWKTDYVVHQYRNRRQERHRRFLVAQSKKRFRALTLALYGEEKEPYQLRDHVGRWM
jgi:hypothetical protein